MEFLDHPIALVLIFWRASIFISTVTAPINSPQKCTRVPFSLHSCQHLLFLVFLIRAIVTGLRWYLTGVLICVSLMIIDLVGHLFTFCGKMSTQILCSFFFLFFYWRITVLQNFVVFCQTSTWISHRYTYIPSILNLPPISHPISPSVDTEPLFEFPEPLQQFPIVYLFHIW